MPNQYYINQRLCKQECFKRLAKFWRHTAPQQASCQHYPVTEYWHCFLFPQHGHCHASPEPRASAGFHKASHQSDVLSSQEWGALVTDKALKQSTYCSVKHFLHVLIIIIFCSQIVPFIWWAQPINLAWIWSCICLEVCFDLKIMLKLCL